MVIAKKVCIHSEPRSFISNYLSSVFGNMDTKSVLHELEMIAHTYIRNVTALVFTLKGMATI